MGDHTRRMQQTFLIASTTGAITAFAALMASWLTGRATIRAAHLQVTANAETQRRDRTRELRRSAYVDLLTYITEIQWRARDVVRRAVAGDEAALSDYRGVRNVIGSEFARRRYIVQLEGPKSVEESVSRIRNAV